MIGIKCLRLTLVKPRVSPQTDASRNALSTAFIRVCHRLPCARYQAKTPRLRWAKEGVDD
jgi:hypothetical protein